jgi:signal transduction histidine kinase
MRLRFRAQLAERNRIAREMHDTLLQGFTGVALKLVATANSLSESRPQSEALREVVKLAQQTLEDARNALWQIRAPMSDSELPDALRTEAQKAAQDSRLDVQVETIGEVRPLPPSIASVVLRIAREAVTNAVRHSDADAVFLKLRYSRRALRLTVSDKGQGFVVDPELRAYGGHLGLLGMRERASEAGGRLMVDSAPGQGTTIRLTIPIEPAHGIDRESPAGTVVVADERQEHGIR